ncbi:MAG: hypothetical protein K2J77_11430 [Oscillospiraceae bacterium]|nr:hypothetical protein [Oscillospiraceae bacterium]
MKSKGKAKQLFCMACAFVASFLVTVTAFATVDLSNDNYIGTYNCESNSNSCIIVYDDYVRVRTYKDNEYNTYYTGVSYNYIISNSSSDNFYADFASVAEVNGSNGRPYYPQIYRQNYIATGDVRHELNVFGQVKSVIIRSKQSEYKYVK